MSGCYPEVSAPEHGRMYIKSTAENSNFCQHFLNSEKRTNVWPQRLFFVTTNYRHVTTMFTTLAAQDFMPKYKILLKMSCFQTLPQHFLDFSQFSCSYLTLFQL